MLSGPGKHPSRSVPYNTGVLTNAEPDGVFMCFRGLDASTLSTWLTRTYRTGYVGKYLNGYEGPGQTYVPPGWDDWAGIVNVYNYLGIHTNDNGQQILDESGLNSPVGFGRHAHDFITRVRHSTNSCFLFLSFVTPHSGTSHTDGDGGLASPFVPVQERCTLYVRRGPPHPETAAYDEADVSNKPDRCPSCPCSARVTRLRSRCATPSVGSR